jgi:hypothetical protein
LVYFKERPSIRARRRIDRENTWWFRDEPSWPEVVEEVFVIKDLVLTSPDSVEITFGHKKTNCPVGPIREGQGVSSD